MTRIASLHPSLFGQALHHVTNLLHHADHLASALTGDLHCLTYLVANALIHRTTH